MHVHVVSLILSCLFRFSFVTSKESFIRRSLLINQIHHASFWSLVVNVYKQQIYYQPLIFGHHFFNHQGTARIVVKPMPKRHIIILKTVFGYVEWHNRAYLSSAASVKGGITDRQRSTVQLLKTKQNDEQQTLGYWNALKKSQFTKCKIRAFVDS